MSRKLNKTAAELAKVHHCHVRTIHAWKKAGAPLHDQKAMRAWLADRKNIPPNTPTETVSTTPIAVVGNQAPGVGPALSRLERAEVLAFEKLQQAQSGSDPLATKAARQNWKDLLNQLRQFERSVSDDKRERGELVNRSEVETWLSNLAAIMRIGSQAMAAEASMTLSGLTDVITIRQIIKKANWQVVVLTYGCLRHMAIPAWILEPFRKDLSNATTFEREDFDRYAQIITDAMRILVPKVAEAEKNAPGAPKQENA